MENNKEIEASKNLGALGKEYMEMLDEAYSKIKPVE